MQQTDQLAPPRAEQEPLCKYGAETTLLHRLRRALLLGSGTICLGLGILGIFLPVLPTTPFLLLAAACFARSSHRFHRWLLYNRWFGNYIRNYLQGRGLSIREKMISIVLLWASIGYSTLFLIDLLALRIVLLSIALGVTIHLVSVPTSGRGAPATVLPPSEASNSTGAR